MPRRQKKIPPVVMPTSNKPFQKRHEQATRTLILQSGMSQPLVDFDRVQDFASRFDQHHLSNTTAEPLFRDMYISAYGDESPLTPESAASALWSFKQMTATKPSEARNDEEEADMYDEIYEELFQGIFTATAVEYTYPGKVNMIDIALRHPSPAMERTPRRQDFSRGSSISTSDSIFSSATDSPETPASAISEPWSMSSLTSSPDSEMIDSKPSADRTHRQSINNSLDDTNDDWTRDDALKPSSRVKTSRLSRNGKTSSMVTTTPFTSTPLPKLRRTKRSVADLWARRPDILSH